MIHKIPCFGNRVTPFLTFFDWVYSVQFNFVINSVKYKDYVKLVKDISIITFCKLLMRLCIA